MATVLVVEDDVILRYTLAEWLRFEGYEVLEAMSADEAVVIFASILSIDLVVNRYRNAWFNEWARPGGADKSKISGPPSNCSFRPPVRR